jgi:hypothetical protein
MKSIIAFLIAILAFVGSTSASAQSTTHDRQFWRAIIKDNYRVPAGESAFALIKELSACLGSPDPELRDDISYSLIYAWIDYQKLLTAAELNQISGEWQANLRIGIGEKNTDTVLLRSFSALALSVISERELKTPFLGEAGYRSLFDNALRYLQDERDLRGFDPVEGWIHSTAHTADLLRFLAAHPLFTVDDQHRLLSAVATRLSTATLIYNYGEQDRLAVALSAIITRQDFDFPFFQSWLANLNTADAKVWRNVPPNDQLLKAFQNNNYLLLALVAHLYGEPKSPNLTASLNEISNLLRSR